MPAQVRQDNDTTGFVIYTHPAYREDDGTIDQDAGRSGDIVQYTLMGKVAATGSWVPFTDETAVDGSAATFGIYMGEDIAEADIIAGDIVDLPIVRFGMTFNEDLLVIENSKTLETVISAAAVNAHTVRDALREQDLIPKETQSASRAENA